MVVYTHISLRPPCTSPDIYRLYPQALVPHPPVFVNIRAPGDRTVCYIANSLQPAWQCPESVLANPGQSLTQKVFTGSGVETAVQHAHRMRAMHSAVCQLERVQVHDGRVRWPQTEAERDVVWALWWPSATPGHDPACIVLTLAECKDVCRTASGMDSFKCYTQQGILRDIRQIKSGFSAAGRSTFPLPKLPYEYPCSICIQNDPTMYTTHLALVPKIVWDSLAPAVASVRTATVSGGHTQKAKVRRTLYTLVSQLLCNLTCMGLLQGRMAAENGSTDGRVVAETGDGFQHLTSDTGMAAKKPAAPAKKRKAPSTDGAAPKRGRVSAAKPKPAPKAKAGTKAPDTSAFTVQDRFCEFVASARKMLVDDMKASLTDTPVGTLFKKSADVSNTDFATEAADVLNKFVRKPPPGTAPKMVSRMRNVTSALVQLEPTVFKGFADVIRTARDAAKTITGLEADAQKSRASLETYKKSAAEQKDKIAALERTIKELRDEAAKPAPLVVHVQSSDESDDDGDAMVKVGGAGSDTDSNSDESDNDF